MDCVADLCPPESAPTERQASWYTPGRVDGFGDRLLMFDHGETEGLELLRFQPSLGSDAGFEQALRRSVERLSPLKSPAFARVRAVERLEAEGSLALVSAHTTARPIADLLDRRGGRGVEPALVTWTVREAIAALTTLHGVGSDIAHGAVNADRVVLTPDGGLTLLEHVLGATLSHLNLTPAHAWSRFGLLVSSPTAICRFDARTDVFQIGALALSMLLARRITVADLPTLPQLLAQWSSTATRSVETERLRAWLETALQIAPGNRTYATAAEACHGLRQLAAPPESSGSSLLQLMAAAGPPSLPVTISPDVDAPPGDGRGSGQQSAPRALPAAAGDTTRHSRWKSVPVWLAVALAAIAIGEAAMGLVIWRTASALGSATVLAAAATDTGPIPVMTTGTSRVRGDIELPKPRRIVPRPGGIRVVAPIELHVLEGDRVLGSSTTGAIVASPGPHDLELVNSALGIRIRQVVRFRPGQVTRIPIELPLGRININADPWAEVWIDDHSVGETPLANVEVALGEHEVVFRHPQLGERRETIVVRGDADAQVSATFEQ
jgi:hypothetical protein